MTRWWIRFYRAASTVTPSRTASAWSPRPDSCLRGDSTSRRITRTICSGSPTTSMRRLAHCLSRRSGRRWSVSGQSARAISLWRVVRSGRKSPTRLIFRHRIAGLRPVDAHAPRAFWQQDFPAGLASGSNLGPVAFCEPCRWRAHDPRNCCVGACRGLVAGQRGSRREIRSQAVRSAVAPRFSSDGSEVGLAALKR